MRKADERYWRIKALRDGATTPGEREAADNALRKHVRKHGEPEDKTPPEPETIYAPVVTLERVGTRIWCRWMRVQPPLSPELWRARAPDGKTVLMTCITTRKEQRCVGCGKTLPKRARMWRAPAYNGNYRMDRLCCECFAPDPKAHPEIEDTA